MRPAKKAELLTCLKSLASEPEVNVKIFDGAAVVQILEPNKRNSLVKTFSDYSRKIFLPYISRQLENTLRIDVVWDVYKPDSLKAFVRLSRARSATMCRG